MAGERSFPIGKIVGCHGIRGMLKVYSYADSFHTFSELEKIQVHKADGQKTSYTITSIKPHKNVLLVKLKEISDIGGAKSLVGIEIFGQRDCLPNLGTDEFYWMDLIGLEVLTSKGLRLGKLDSVFRTGSNDVYVIKDTQKGRKENEILLPALKSVVISIDLDLGKMIVELPEGLL